MIKLNKSENNIKTEKLQLNPNSQIKELNIGIDLPKLNENLDIKKNYSFRGGANNLLIRNYLSLNSNSFEKLIMKTPKQYKTIFHQNCDENDYLQPFKAFKCEHKYDIPSNSINKEMYNIIRKKIYIKDNNSSIIQGKQISKDDFIHQKKDLMYINNKNNTSRNINRSMKEKFLEKIKIYDNPINIKEKIRELKEKTCDEIVKEKYAKKQLKHSLSSRLLNLKQTINTSREELKSINTHVDKNHNIILRSRNWWKVE